jgi:hypothetical protein
MVKMVLRTSRLLAFWKVDEIVTNSEFNNNKQFILIPITTIIVITIRVWDMDRWRSIVTVAMSLRVPGEDFQQTEVKTS